MRKMRIGFMACAALVVFAAGCAGVRGKPESGQPLVYRDDAIAAAIHHVRAGCGREYYGEIAAEHLVNPEIAFFVSDQADVVRVSLDLGDRMEGTPQGGHVPMIIVDMRLDGSLLQAQPGHRNF
jgi:hypothetical protein